MQAQPPAIILFNSAHAIDAADNAKWVHARAWMDVGLRHGHGHGGFLSWTPPIARFRCTMHVGTTHVCRRNLHSSHVVPT